MIANRHNSLVHQLQPCDNGEEMRSNTLKYLSVIPLLEVEIECVFKPSMIKKVLLRSGTGCYPWIHCIADCPTNNQTINPPPFLNDAKKIELMLPERTEIFSCKFNGFDMFGEYHMCNECKPYSQEKIFRVIETERHFIKMFYCDLPVRFQLCYQPYYLSSRHLFNDGHSLQKIYFELNNLYPKIELLYTNGVKQKLKRRDNLLCLYSKITMINGENKGKHGIVLEPSLNGDNCRVILYEPKDPDKELKIANDKPNTPNHWSLYKVTEEGKKDFMTVDTIVKWNDVKYWSPQAGNIWVKCDGKLLRASIAYSDVVGIDYIVKFDSTDEMSIEDGIYCFPLPLEIERKSKITYRKEHKKI